MNRRRISTITVASALLLFAGCLRNSSGEKETPAIPNEIEVAQATWSVQSLDKKDKAMLDRHFANTPGLGDNPAFGGEMAMYVGPKGERRFYWLSPTSASSQWICLAFDGRRRFESSEEGEGPPFDTQPD